MTALCCFSENTSNHIKSDSVVISVKELRAANRIFVEHEYLKKIVPLIEYENQQLRNNVSRYARIDSIQEIRVDFIAEKSEKKNRRLKIALFATIFISVVLLLVK